MYIFIDNGAIDRKTMPIGEINPCSIYDISGQSYVHLNDHYRKSLGLENYDEFFPIMRKAYEWLCERLRNVNVMGCVYDFEVGHCKTLEDIIN